MSDITKQPSEKFYVSVDFSAILDIGETIDAIASTVTAADSSGNDVTSTFIDASALTASSGILQSRIMDGNNNTNYKVTFTAHTSLGNIFERDVTVFVYDS